MSDKPVMHRASFEFYQEGNTDGTTDDTEELKVECMGIGDLSEGFGLEYNLFACEEAIKIATSLRSKDKIIEFHKSSWEDQKLMVPSISDDHSGNTFGMACKIAMVYLPFYETNTRDEKLNEIIGE